MGKSGLTIYRREKNAKRKADKLHQGEPRAIKQVEPPIGAIEVRKGTCIRQIPTGKSQVEVLAKDQWILTSVYVVDKEGGQPYWYRPRKLV